MSRVLVLKETGKSWDIDRGWCGNRDRQLWQRLIIHLNLVKIKTYIQSHRSATCIYLPARFMIIPLPRSPKGRGGDTVLPLSVRPRYFSSHFSQQLLMAEIWYLVTSLPHIMGSGFGPIRFLFPVCRFCWFLYTFNIHLYMHIFLSNCWWQIWYLVTSFI